MQAMRLLISLAASALAVANVAEGNTFAAACWAFTAVCWLVMVVRAEDGR